MVYVRLGDWTPTRVNEMATAVRRVLKNATGIERIVFSGIINFGGYGDFIPTNTTIENSVRFMHELNQTFTQEGYPSMIRSEPVADNDLLYLSSAKNLAIAGAHGFPMLVWDIRQKFKKLQDRPIPLFHKGGAKSSGGRELQTWVLDWGEPLDIASD